MTVTHNSNEAIIGRNDINNIEAILSITNHDVDEVEHIVKDNADAIFTWDYSLARPQLRKLYEKAKVGQWNGTTDLPWDTDVDLEKGLFPEATASFERALRLHPERADVRTNYGVALERQGLLEQAAKQFEQVLQEDPSHLEARNGLGVVRFRAGDLAEAEREFERITRAEPAFAEARRNLGLVCQARGELAQAAAHLRVAVELDPDDAATRNVLGSFLERQNDLSGALEHVAEIGNHVLEHTDDEAAGNRAARARNAANERASEAIEQDAGHHVRLEIDDRRNEDACDRADGRSEAPAKRQHPVDVDADEPRRRCIQRRRSHGEPERREAEEAEKKAEHRHGNEDHPDLMRPDDA